MPLESKVVGVVYDASYDVIVIGGGVAGVCAAIAAARHGATVALVHDRPVLGGNSSSEVRVNAGGADHHGARRHARESGILEELRLEDRVRNHTPISNGYINFVWDHVLLDAVWRERGLALYLNSSALHAIMSDEDTVEGIVAYQSSTYRMLHLRGGVFIDASGDGVVAADAGAHFRVGREPRGEFNEPHAPENGDSHTLGSSLLFAVRDLGRPVPFTPPAWAHKFPSDAALPHRDHHYFPHAGFWWIEFGGLLDTIADTERVRDELLRCLLGVWDHLKNHGDHGAANYVLDWVGAVPGKRESRRFLGDTILTENDVVKATPFPDTVAYGGWPIDLHPPEGIHSNEPPCAFIGVPKVYPIPFGSLFSRNIRNLMFAGRNISASHVAFGSTRLIATGAVMGQAVGTAAALCKRHDTTPRAIQRQHITELQQLLLRDDAYVPGAHNQDPADLARLAHASATSSPELRVEPKDCGTAALGCAEASGRAQAGAPVPHCRAIPLDTARAQLFPVSADRVDAAEVLLESTLDREVELVATLRWAESLDDFSHASPVATATAHVPSRSRGWVALDFHQALKPRALYVLVLEPPAAPSSPARDAGRGTGDATEGPAAGGTGPRGPGRSEEAGGKTPESSSAAVPPSTLDPRPSSPSSGIAWLASGDEPPGTQRATCLPDGTWRYLGEHGTHGFRLHPPSRPFEPDSVVNGIARPEGWPNLWISDPAQPLPQSLILDFGTNRAIASVHLTFDTNLNHLVAFGPAPECVRDYVLSAFIPRPPAPSLSRPPAPRGDASSAAPRPSEPADGEGAGSWLELVRISGNYQRRRIHTFPPVTASKLRLDLLATNGSPTARVYEIRAYGP